jgi:hypothetical protein
MLNRSSSQDLMKVIKMVTGNKNAGISLPLHIVQHLDCIRGDYPRSKFVLSLIRAALKMREQPTQ